MHQAEESMKRESCHKESYCNVWVPNNYGIEKLLFNFWNSAFPLPLLFPI